MNGECSKFTNCKPSSLLKLWLYIVTKGSKQRRHDKKWCTCMSYSDHDYPIWNHKEITKIRLNFHKNEYQVHVLANPTSSTSKAKHRIQNKAQLLAPLPVAYNNSLRKLSSTLLVKGKGGFPWSITMVKNLLGV